MAHPPIPRDEIRAPQIIYALYLAGIVTANITLLIGVIIAYVYRKEAAPWLQQHYRYLIRTFWIGTLYACIAFLLSIVVVGTLLWPLLAVWLGVRCVLGWVDVRKGLTPARLIAGFGELDVIHCCHGRKHHLNAQYRPRPNNSPTALQSVQGVFCRYFPAGAVPQ